MVKLAHLLSFASLPLALTLASNPDEWRDYCLTEKDAFDLRRKWISFSVNIDTNLAKATLTADFTEYSSSLNPFINKEAEEVTYKNRDEFIQTQLSLQQQAPKDPKFTVLSTTFTCDQVWFRWVDRSEPRKLHGFDEFYVKKDRHGKFQIYKAYSEFNSAAVLANAGLFPCSSSSSGAAPGS